MAKSLPSQRFWDTMEILRINKGENIAENDTKKFKGYCQILGAIQGCNKIFGWTKEDYEPFN